jgi:hypothetical protein
MAGQDRKIRVTGERREVIDVQRIAGVLIRLVETRRLRAQGLVPELEPADPDIGSIKGVPGDRDKSDI